MNSALIDNVKKLYDIDKKEVPNLKIGSTVKLGLRVKEASGKAKKQKEEEGKAPERIQYFEGIIIRKAGSGLSRNITVRKIASNSIGVEKILPVYSPTIASIEVIKESKVRRAKLLYMRGRKGKAATTV